MSAPVPGLRLRIGNTLVDAGAGSDVAAGIAAWNASRRLDGLPDEFNPAIIDPMKASALLAALTPEAVAGLGGKALDLDGTALRISTSSPTTPESFEHGVTLAVASEHGASVTARAELPLDCELARTRAQAARQRAGEAEQQEKAAQGGAASAARKRRYAVSLVWWDNATAAAACAPADGAAAADRDAALAAAKAAMILGGSMQ